MLLSEHLEQAEKYAKELFVERKIVGYRDGTLSSLEAAQLQADQGLAMRGLVFHCTAAIVAAVRP